MRAARLLLAFAREINFINIKRLTSLVRSEGGIRSALISVKSASKTVVQANYTVPWTPKSVIEPLEIQHQMSPREVAFVIYCYFPEYVERVKRLIAKFNDSHPAVDFYVASPDLEIVSKFRKIQSEFKALKAVTISQNRGRNFGPLFVEFSTAMMNYEYVVHLHSKRSSHSRKRTSSLWANSLWRAMGEDTEIFESFVQEFRTNSEIAIAYSLVESLFPPRAFSWGTNGSETRATFEAGVPKLRDTMDSDRFPFPAGGMFIFRTCSFKSLLTMHWSYEIFPEETGQLDGTAQHVLERLMGFIPHSEGQKQLVFLERSQVFTTDTSFILD